jgi:transposase-like protein
MSDQPEPADLPAQVRTACTTLAQHHGVTFPAVAEHTGISRATLYRRRDLREIIEAHRNPDGHTPTITGLATQIDQLRQALEAVAAKVRRHEEDLRTIKREGPHTTR